MADAAANAYGQLESAGSVDQAVRSMVQDVGVRLPLAMLLVSTLPAELDRRIRSAAYVERNVLAGVPTDHVARSEEHTSELQSLMRISYAVFCLKKKNTITTTCTTKTIRTMSNYQR